jgi:hypothetical protein
MKIIVIITGLLVGLVLVGWLGLQITPKPFPAVSKQVNQPTTMSLPQDLPIPVARFYRQLYPENIPVVETAIISGRGKLRLNGITFPARFRFTHIAGRDYRHYIEATFYGLPLLKVNEHFIDGSSRFDLPFGISEGAKVGQGANLALWAEAVWMPSVWVTNPLTRWEPVDEHAALLIVPFGDQEQRFLMRFDPQTGLLDLLESMRYRGEESEQKTLWINQVREWDLSGDKPVPRIAAITWFDQGIPWAVLTTEQVVFNQDVTDYIRQKGP